MGDFWSGETPYDTNAPKREARDAARQREKEKGLQGQVEQYSDPNARGFNISGSFEERQKALDGLNLAKVGYGQDIFQTGSDIADIRKRQQERSQLADPISEAIRSQKAGSVANASRGLASQGIKGGAAAGAVANVERAANADVAASLYGQQSQSLANERSMASNTLSGTVGLMQGGKAEGTQSPELPKASSWTDSVICTELHRQGIMPSEMYQKDAAYGDILKAEWPEVIEGYHFLANPVVKLMQKSPLATKLIAPIALEWGKYIAGDFSALGFVLFHVGQPICAIIGKIKFLGVKVCSLRP
jgi:hypothetical protein